MTTEELQHWVKELTADIRRTEKKLVEMRTKRTVILREIDMRGTPPLPGLDKVEECAISGNELVNVGNKFLPTVRGVCRCTGRPDLAVV